MLDKAPLPRPDRGRTLVMLTHRYRNLPRDERLVHVQPTREVRADKIDFTDSSKVGDTWDQGVADAERWLAGEELC